MNQEQKCLGLQLWEDCWVFSGTEPGGVIVHRTTELLRDRSARDHGSHLAPVFLQGGNRSSQIRVQAAPQLMGACLIEQYISIGWWRT